MKKIYLLFISAFAVMSALTSCVEDVVELESASLMYSIEIDMAVEDKVKIYVDETESRTLPMLVGESIQLSYITNPEDQSELTHPGVAWSSSNEAVVSVTPEGKITAVSEGVAVVTVTPSTVNLIASASLKVTVFKTVTKATSIEITAITDHVSEMSDYPSCYAGDTLTLVAKVKPEEATYKTVLWSSKDPETALVDPISGAVVGVKPGEAEIVATALDEGKVTASQKVYIDEVVMPQGLKVTNLPGEDEVYSVGDGTWQFDVETIPAKATKSRIVWESDNPAVATVDNGKVTFNMYGKVNITATCPESDATLPEGYAKKVEFSMNIPAGYYRETFDQKFHAEKWVAASNGTVEYKPASGSSEAYNLYVPGVQNEAQKKYRVDASRSGKLYLTRDYPFVCIRVDDVNDKGFSRALKLDTRGVTDEGMSLWGDLGGGSGTWTLKHKCSDGSAILIYNLNEREFKVDGGNSVMPAGQVATFTTFCLKYADIVLPDDKTLDDISYRMFWFNTFKTEEAMNEYLAEWSLRTQIAWGDNMPGDKPEDGGEGDNEQPGEGETPGDDEPVVGAKTGLKVLNAPAADAVFSMSDAGYQIKYEKAAGAGELVWSSSDEKIAVVAGGKVTFKYPGMVTISVSCPEVEAEVEEGYLRSADVTFNIPAGYYREEFDVKSYADLWEAASNGTKSYHAATASAEAYNLYVPAVQNAEQKKYRVDAKHSATTYLHSGYPYLCFRIDDVNDKGISRALKVDTNGNTESGVRLYGDLGGGSGTWTTKYKCSDGSAILIYDLQDRNFKTDGNEPMLLPENDILVLGTFAFKYADIVLPDDKTVDDISYRMFWFNTFRTESEMKAYLDDWSSKTGITYNE